MPSSHCLLSLFPLSSLTLVVVQVEGASLDEALVEGAQAQDRGGSEGATEAVEPSEAASDTPMWGGGRGMGGEADWGGERSEGTGSSSEL